MNTETKTVAEFQVEISKQEDAGMAMILNSVMDVLIDDEKIFSRDDEFSIEILEKIRQGIYGRKGLQDPMLNLQAAQVSKTGNPFEAALQHVENLAWS